MRELVAMPVRTPRPGDLEPIETASRDELAALQLRRIRQTLKHAYDNVDHYRNAFERHGVHPNDLSTLDDLARFPFTVKSDLREHYPFGMFAVPRRDVVRIHASSGTTGKPTVVGYTRNDVDTWATVMARSIRAAGGRAGDIVHDVPGASAGGADRSRRSEEHTSELQSHSDLVCRLLLEKKKTPTLRP